MSKTDSADRLRKSKDTEHHDNESCQILVEAVQMKELRIKETSDNLFFTFDDFLLQGKKIGYQALSDCFREIPRDKLNSRGPQVLDPIRYIHSLAKLDSVQMHLSRREQRELDAESKALLQQLPENMREEYEVQIQLLDFANLLIAKYGLTATDFYNYRIRGRGLLVRCLDLLHLNERVVSADALWLAVTLPTGSFQDVATARTKELSKIFTAYAARVMTFLLEADAQTSWRQPVTYSILFCKTWNVKKLVTDLQQSHLAFEKSLVEDIIALSALN